MAKRHKEAVDDCLAILLVEDNRCHAELVQRMLESVTHVGAAGYMRFDVTHVPTIEAAREELEGRTFGAVLLDLQLSDSIGLNTLATVRAAVPLVPVIVLTSSDDDRLAFEAIQQGAQDYLAKEDLDGRLLGRTIRHAVERNRTERQLRCHAAHVELTRKRIEKQAEELKVRTEKLDRINRELDEFTYIASHDLKEPLRGIAAYCEILSEDYHDKIDEKGQYRLNTLMHLCHRLEALIEDLLTYCRVGGAHVAETSVDLRDVIKGTLATLRPSIDSRQATITVSPQLPTVIGDPTLIGMVFANLISNGLKFNRSENPHVEVGYVPGEPATVFVHDNGIGISEDHHEAVFAIFRRLHSRKEYEGTGVGLTIVRKIVESHGGRVWLESKPGRGTTFYLTFVPSQEGKSRTLPVQEPVTRPPHWIAIPQTLAGAKHGTLR